MPKRKYSEVMESKIDEDNIMDMISKIRLMAISDKPAPHKIFYYDPTYKSKDTSICIYIQNPFTLAQ